MDQIVLPLQPDVLFSTVIERVAYDPRPGEVASRGGPLTKVMNWDDLKNCGNATYSPTTVSNIDSNGVTTVMWSDRCNPTIVIPDNIRTVLPEWNTCSGFLVNGVPDPPVALMPAKQPLSPVPAEPTPISNDPPVQTSPSPAESPPVSGPAPTKQPEPVTSPPAPKPVDEPPTALPVTSDKPPKSDEPKDSNPVESPKTPGTSNPPKDSSPPKGSTPDPGPTPQPAPQKPTTKKILDESVTLLPSNGGVQIGSHTLRPGAAPITIHGTRVSVGSNGVVVVGKSKTTIHSEPPAAIAPTPTPMAVGPTGISIGGHLLTPGGPPITISGTVISLGSSELVMGSSTTTFRKPSGVAAGTGLAGGSWGSSGGAGSPSEQTSAGIGAAILSALGWQVTPVSPSATGLNSVFWGAGGDGVAMATGTATVGRSNSSIIIAAGAAAKDVALPKVLNAWAVAVVGWYLWG